MKSLQFFDACFTVYRQLDAIENPDDDTAQLKWLSALVHSLLTDGRGEELEAALQLNFPEYHGKPDSPAHDLFTRNPN